MKLQEEAVLQTGAAEKERRLYVLQEDLRFEPGRQVPPHAHPGATEVYVIASGSAVVEIAGRSSSASPGDVVVVPPGGIHSMRVGPDGVSLSSFMAFSSLASFAVYRAKRLVQDTPLLAAVHRRLRRRG